MHKTDDQDELRSKVLESFNLEGSFSGRDRTGPGRSIFGIVTALLLTTVAVASQTRSMAPFVGTPPDVVERMLTLAKITSRDVVYDIGSGDGRVVIMAAQKFGARGVGIDIDPVLIARAEAAAKAAGV